MARHALQHWLKARVVEVESFSRAADLDEPDEPAEEA
jgi:hypothetical protein